MKGCKIFSFLWGSYIIISTRYLNRIELQYLKRGIRIDYYSPKGKNIN